MKENKKIIVTYNSPFLNSDTILVEYNDVLKSPFFILLMSIKDNDVLKILFNLTELESLDIDSLYEWYINRKGINIFKCLNLNEGILEEYFNNDREIFNKWCDDTLNELINNNPYFVEYDSELNFSESFKTLLHGSLVKKYYVYTENYSEVIKEDILKIYGDKVIYVYGNLSDVIKENKITSNSTFVFSNIKNILSLEESNIINLSSIIIADKYSYNYKGKNELIIDVDRLNSKYTFKLDFFDNLNDYE